jgi:hypothetical protein
VAALALLAVIALVLFGAVSPAAAARPTRVVTGRAAATTSTTDDATVTGNKGPSHSRASNDKNNCGSGPCPPAPKGK